MFEFLIVGILDIPYILFKIVLADKIGLIFYKNFFKQG